MELSSSKKAKVSAIELTPQPLILESGPMEATSIGKNWVAEELVNSMS
jgi:hypothetical protein